MYSLKGKLFIISFILSSPSFEGEPRYLQNSRSISETSLRFESSPLATFDTTNRFMLSFRRSICCPNKFDTRRMFPYFQPSTASANSLTLLKAIFLRRIFLFGFSSLRYDSTYCEFHKHANIDSLLCATLIRSYPSAYQRV